MKDPKVSFEAADDNPLTVKSFGTLINEYDPMSIDSRLLYSYLKKEVLQIQNLSDSYQATEEDILKRLQNPPY